MVSDLNTEYCGDHSADFWSNGQIGPCWRSLVSAAPFGLFLAWWGAGSFFLTRSRHRVVLRFTEIGALDIFRAVLCFILMIEAPLLLAFVKEDRIQPHEFVDSFAASAAQWFFVGLMIIDSALRARRDANVIRIATTLSLFDKFLLTWAVVHAGKKDYGEEDYSTRKGWMIGSLIITLVAFFSITCVARDFRTLQKRAIRVSEAQVSLLDEHAVNDIVGEGREFHEVLEENASPEEYVGIFSQLTFSWLSNLMRLGYSRSLSFDDLYHVRFQDSSHVLYSKLIIALKKNQSLTYALYSSGVLSPFLWAAPLKFIYDVLLFIVPATLLRSFIEFLAEDDTDDNSSEWYTSRGTKLAIGIFAIVSIQTFILHVYFNLVFRAGMRVKAALITTIFNKSLRLSLSSRNASSQGDLANLVSTDAQKMQNLFPYLHVVWSAPLQIALCTFFLWRELKWAAVVALGSIVVLVILITSLIANRMEALSTTLMTSKDARVRATTEALSSMKLLKLYGWETIFKDKIADAREEELAILRKFVEISAVSRILWNATPIVVTVITFGAFALMGGNLDAATAFVSVTLLNLLHFPMAMLPTMFSGAIEANVSLKRVEKFLNLEELRSIAEAEPVLVESRRGSFDLSFTNSAASSNDQQSHTLRHVESFRRALMSPYPTFSKAVPSVAVGGPALEMINGNFYWDDACEHKAIEDIHLRLSDGEILVVTGEVGSGKSALILGLLGELVSDPTNVPYVSLNGSVSYSPEIPWIRNASVRDNILFDEPYDPEFYNQVIDACALRPDLEQFPNHDLTEVGEKGINLSGGQKARISLARSVYSRSDIMLLESCFEAVDEHVASILWKQCFFGIMKKYPSKAGRKRTVVIVTHSTKNEVEDVDRVVIMSQGRIAITGSPKELKNNELYRGLRRAHPTTTENTDQQAEATTKTNERRTSSVHSLGNESEASVESFTSNHIQTDKEAAVAGKLITEEKATVRGVNAEVYRLYLKALGGNLVFALVILFSTIRIAADIGTLRWLAHWSDDTESGADEDHTLFYYLGTYAALSVASVVMVLIVSFTIALLSLRASKWYHEELLSSIMRAPMRFFDSTPLGRITQRFTKDMYTLDSIMSELLWMMVAALFEVFATVIVVAIVNPYFMIPLPFLFMVYLMAQRYYVRTSRELKNLESISLSPIFSHFSETLGGCVSVRAYKSTDTFINANYTKLDRNLSAYYMSNSCNRWLAVRMEFVANFLIFMAALLTSSRKGHISASLAGMAVSYTLTMSQSLNWFVRMLSELETNIVSVERIDEYAHHIDSEAPLETAIVVPANWPSRGEIAFRDVYSKYREDLGYVHKGLNLSVSAGAHVGICGQTGCGKSTLFLMILRIIEASKGVIEIDGIDISKIGLKRLRDSISIIPQDAVLFRTSLRLNLDPTGTKDDSELWRALEICELSDFARSKFLSSSASPLDYVIAEGGTDFSFGQRQLLCIARAMLRDTKILLSDEASSGIDRITDHKIQEMIRKEFSSRTTLTIAHRLETIMSSDLVAVMDNGQVIEYAEPSVLLSNHDSRFYKLANDMKRQEQHKKG